MNTAVDLFCGAGGASCGIHAAGFELVAAVDHSTDALNTHAENLPGYTVRHDLSEVDTSVLPERARSPDYLHGSPPCKGFSTAKGNRSLDDPRNSLVFDFVDWVETLNPKVVTMENVVGMTNISTRFMDKVTSAFRDSGFAVKWQVLNAADYGVPQTRRRVITVGIRDDLNIPTRWFPRPTHAETPTTTLDGRQLDEWISVKDAIGDLGMVGSHRQQGDNNGTNGCVWRQPTEPSHTVKGQGSHTVRADGGTVQNHVAQNHTEQARKRFTDILAGRREANGLSGRVAELSRPSPTITADETAAVPPIRPPEQSEGPRRLTVRECARLQSFPDSFIFEGTKTSQYAQVGNAVPPRLQYHIANHLRNLWTANAGESE